MSVGQVANKVILVVTETPYEIDKSVYDKINITSIKCATGRLVVAGCSYYFPEATRIKVEPGTYRVVVGYKKLNDLSEDQLDGNDSYHVFLSNE